MGQKVNVDVFNDRDFKVIFSLLLISVGLIAWCFTSALAEPLKHLACPLLNIF